MKLKKWNQGHSRFPAGKAWLAAVTAFIAASQFAQAAEVYTWTDKDGVQHFSQTPPDTDNSEVLEVEEAYRPGSSGVYPDVNDAADSNDPLTESPQSLAQQRYEQLAKDRAERKEKQAETQKLCNQNESLLERLEPARRVYYTNEQGEEVRMDDQARMELIDQTREFVDKNCR